MNYRLFTDTKNPRLISNFNKPVEFKPQVNDIINIGISRTPWVITREQKNTASSEEDVSFDFFAKIQNTSPDSISMARDFQSIQRKLNSGCQYERNDNERNTRT